MLLEEMAERIHGLKSAELSHFVHPFRGHRQVILRNFHPVHGDELTGCPSQFLLDKQTQIADARFRFRRHSRQTDIPAWMNVNIPKHCPDDRRISPVVPRLMPRKLPQQKKQPDWYVVEVDFFVFLRYISSFHLRSVIEGKDMN